MTSEEKLRYNAATKIIQINGRNSLKLKNIS